jgi:hypothetical protein
MVTKLVKCYNRKTKDSQITKMEDSLIAEALSAFVAPPVRPSVVVVPATSALPVGTMNSVLVTQITPKGALVATSSVDVRFLRRGFLKPSSYAGWGCCPSATLGVINL